MLIAEAYKDYSPAREIVLIWSLTNREGETLMSKKKRTGTIFLILLNGKVADQARNHKVATRKANRLRGKVPGSIEIKKIS